MSTIQVRTEPALKRSVQRILKSLGLDLSSAINLYLMQIRIHKGIPFRILTENGFLPEQEESMLREIAAAKKTKGHSSARELHQDILGK